MKTLKLEQFKGKTLEEVYSYLKETYGENNLAKTPEDLSTLPEEMKNGDWYYFFGSVSSRNDSEFAVQFVSWRGGSFRVGAFGLGTSWASGGHVILQDTADVNS